MVTPQQRGQVVVKSIGDINRETTVRARRTTRAAQNMAAIGQINGVAETVGGAFGLVKKYYDISGSRWNHLATGVIIGHQILNPNSVVRSTKLLLIPVLIHGGISVVSGLTKTFGGK